MRTLFFLVVFIFINVFTTTAQENVVVTDVKVTFFVPVGTDDKDVNTQISATLYTGMGKRVAMLDKCCGNIHFPDDNYTSSTYQLDMRATIFKSDIQSGYFDLHIDPVGNDRWFFVPTFQIFFSDGTKVIIKGEDSTAPYTKREVSQQAPDTSFPFHL